MTLSRRLRVVRGLSRASQSCLPTFPRTRSRAALDFVLPGVRTQHSQACGQTSQSVGPPCQASDQSYPLSPPYVPDNGSTTGPTDEPWDSEATTLGALLAAERHYSKTLESLLWVEEHVSKQFDQHVYSPLTIATTLTRLKDLGAAVAALRAQQAWTSHPGSHLALVAQSKADEATATARAQRARYESLRREYNFAVEARPVAYRVYQCDKPIIRFHLHILCRLCGSPHDLGTCPYLLPGLDVPAFHCLKTPSGATHFHSRLRFDAEFREAVWFLRKTFSRAPESSSIIPHHREVKHPPASAIPYLQEFDRCVWFRTIYRSESSKADEAQRRTSRMTRVQVRPPFSYLEGYHVTTDNDGRKLIILW